MQQELILYLLQKEIWHKRFYSYAGKKHWKSAYKQELVYEGADLLFCTVIKKPLFIRPLIEKAKPGRNSSLQLLWKVINTWPAPICSPVLGNTLCLCRRSSAWTQWAIYTLDCYHTCHFGIVRNSHTADVVVGSSRHLSCTPCPVAVKKKAERPDEPQLMHVLSWAGSLWFVLPQSAPSAAEENYSMQNSWVLNTATCSFLAEAGNIQFPLWRMSEACSEVNMYPYTAFNCKVIQAFSFQLVRQVVPR